MKDLGTFHKTRHVIQFSVTERIIIAVLLAFGLSVAGVTAKEHYRKDALQMQEMLK